LTTESQIQMTAAGITRVLQIITIALITGVVVFGGIVVLVLGGLSKPPQGQMLSMGGVAFAVIAFVMHLVIPEILVKQAIKTSNNQPASLVGLFMTKTIIASALLEGAAFFNLIALMIEHNWWSLVVVGGLVLWMAAQIPNVIRTEHWVESKQLELR
jgi:hypothetical protein